MQHALNCNRLQSSSTSSNLACKRQSVARAGPLQARSLRCFSLFSETTSEPGLVQQQETHKVLVPELPKHHQQQQAPDGSSSSSKTEGLANPAEEIGSWLEQYKMPDEMSLWDDGGSYYSSRRDLQLAYLPPKSDLPGFTAAMGLIAAWACLFKHAIWGYNMFEPMSLPHLLDGLLTFASLEFVSTGLFITTHDSMHGTVTPNSRFLNDVIGATCISLYAWFDYSMMWTKHWEHHNNTGQPHEDPDFHKGDPALLPWFVSFMKGYISIPQFVKLQATVLFLMYFGAPLPNMLLFWAGSGLVSAVRLFYYGTYMPHKPRKGGDEVMSWAKARSASAPSALSFLRCYFFDMHWEHHRWPFAPWWDLPHARSIRYQAMGSLDD